jgi:hypothetical protein
MTEETKIGQEEFSTVEVCAPYTLNVSVRGTSDLLFHKYSIEESIEGDNKRKGSKKYPEPDTYLYKDEQNRICIPSEHFRMSVVYAAKFRKDPRSPKKSMLDLMKAGVFCEEDLIPLGKSTPDYYHRARVKIGSAAIVRVRPALLKGWECKLSFTIILPEYISQEFFHEVLIDAGRLCGVGDFRPTYGRFQVTKIEVR